MTQIAFVNNSRDTFTPTSSGAIATVLWEVCREARRTGIEPWVVSPGSPDPPYDWSRLLLVPAPSVPGGLPGRGLRIVRRLSGWARVGQWSYARSVARHLKKLHPTVIVCNNDPEVAAYLSKRFPAATVVHWFHNLELAGDRWRRALIGDGRLRCIAVSDYLARAAEYLYPGRSITTVHNGVDLERFRAAPATDAASGARPVIAFIGRLGAEKGPDLFLKACTEVAAQRTDFEVLLVGDVTWGTRQTSPFRDYVDGLEAALREQGIPVRRTGHLVREDIPAAFRSADIFVVPSRWDDPCPLVVLEGMASGAAPVVSATGGMPELVGDSGLLFPREDTVALSQRLLSLLEDPARRRDLALAARQRAEDFTWRRTWQGLATVAGIDRSADGPSDLG